MSRTVSLHPTRQGACQRGTCQRQTPTTCHSHAAHKARNQDVSLRYLRGLRWHILCPLIAPAVKYKMTAIYCRVYKKSLRASISGGSSKAGYGFYTHMGNAYEGKLIFFFN